jgi:hypothetical protein
VRLYLFFPRFNYKKGVWGAGNMTEKSPLLEEIYGNLSKLPLTREDFNIFVDKVIELAGVDKDESYIEFVAASIMHVDQDKDEMPIEHFARCLRKSIANNMSYAVIKELRDARTLKQKQEEVTSQPPQGDKIVESPQEGPN